MRLKKVILALGMMLGVAWQASAAQILLTFNNAPFYTDNKFAKLEGGSVSGTIFYDSVTGLLSQPLFYTTPGSVITTGYVWDTLIDPTFTSVIYVTDAASAPDLSITGPGPGVGDELGLAIAIGPSGPDSFTFEVVQQLCIASGCKSSDGALMRYALSEVTLSPVPEPMTVALFTAGVLGLGAVRKRARAG